MDVLMLQARAALSAMTPHEHVSLIDALSQQQHQYRPGPVFMSVYLSQVANHLPDLTVSQQAALATGLATVGYKPGTTWMAAFMSQLLSQPVTGADGEDLLQLLRALRRMQYVPAPNMAQQLSGLIDSVQLSVPYNQLLLLREALDELQYQMGIMAVPGGPRRAAEAAAAAAAVVVSASGAEGAASAEAGVAAAPGGDVMAIDGVVDPAALQVAQEFVVQAEQQVQLAQQAARQAEELSAGLEQQGGQPQGFEGPTGGVGSGSSGAPAAREAAAAMQAEADAAAAPSTPGTEQAGAVAAGEGVAAEGGKAAEGAAIAPARLGIAQESLELFA
jgi:hypothetical protein